MIETPVWQSEDPGSCPGDAWLRGLDSSCPVIHTVIIKRQRHQDCSSISRVSFEGSLIKTTQTAFFRTSPKCFRVHPKTIHGTALASSSVVGWCQHLCHHLRDPVLAIALQLNRVRVWRLCCSLAPSTGEKRNEPPVPIEKNQQKSAFGIILYTVIIESIENDGATSDLEEPLSSLPTNSKHPKLLKATAIKPLMNLITSILETCKGWFKQDHDMDKGAKGWQLRNGRIIIRSAKNKIHHILYSAALHLPVWKRNSWIRKNGKPEEKTFENALRIPSDKGDDRMKVGVDRW